ncbi:hypothetical protein I302_105688 [Kwoniella bestiolae CBS 10118]|uniref:Thioredoxin domain-containing protein n=1 Tax=Kwoniella bestiolae CBS 10118 TaxID=1296100 RepID=A0A1B9G1X7_9TREE|nr:hypothetical protein I302_04808 [Kwoniella bestiolae CBS 10118]OCF24998.1 hypothetical protein I302_04808 [Kwoniella bestiolae CBS 10118]
MDLENSPIPSSSPFIPRSQSLSTHSSPALSHLHTPSRSQSISTGASTSERRLSRKLPPAWTESLENLARTSPPTINSNGHAFNRLSADFELCMEEEISPMSKTIQLPVPVSSGSSKSRPYVLDVDTPQSSVSAMAMVNRSSSHSQKYGTNVDHNIKTRKASIGAEPFPYPASSSMVSHHSSSSSSTSNNNNNNMGFLKSSKSSSSRSDILLTPKYQPSKLRGGSIDSTDSYATSATGSSSRRRRARERCGSASCETWSLFDEVKLEDSLSSSGKKIKEKKHKETSKEKKERVEQEKAAFDEDRAPTQKMLFEASLLEVIDERGKKVRFGDLVRNRRTIVIFIRHWYCPLCAQYMNSILAEVSLDALEEANVDLIIIGNGSDKMLDGYRNKSFRCPFKMYTDPTLALYRSLGLTRQTGNGGDEEHKGDYLVQSAMESTVQTVKRATRMPLRNPGHFTQLGGEFIFDGTLNCIYTHRMTTTRSHKPIRDICEEAGVRLEFIHYEPGLPPPPVHRHSFFGVNAPTAGTEVDDWQMERDQTINRIKALKAARRGGPVMVHDTRSRVVDHVQIVGQDLDAEEDEVVLGFSALGIAT